MLIYSRIFVYICVQVYEHTQAPPHHVYLNYGDIYMKAKHMVNTKGVITFVPLEWRAGSWCDLNATRQIFSSKMFVLSVTLISLKWSLEKKKSHGSLSSIAPFIVHFSVYSQLDTSVQFCNPDIENITVNNIAGNLEKICY